MTIAPDFIKSISAISKTSSRKGEIIKRKTHSFNIRLTGSMRYNFKDKSMVVHPGEMISLPEGMSYTYCVDSEEESTCTIINMVGDFPKNSEPKIYHLQEFYSAEYIMYHLPDAWNFGTTADKYKCISHIYDLLAYMDNYDNLKYMEKKKFKIIEPAIVFLKNHIYDTNLKTESLAQMCGISNTYFRNIFSMRFGSSPKNYITEKRLAKAKAIIDSGEFDSVNKLALSVGFDDALYFGKVFKKHFGMPPREMNK